MVSISAVLVSLALTQAPPWLNGESQGEDLVVSLVTFSPGDSVPEWWGHTAVVVEDTKRNHARLYNYGMFGFDQGFFERFAKGRLEFWVDDEPVGPNYQMYRQLNRDVRIQELNLTPPQALKLARSLAENVLPENRTYLYQHYFNNCSTRPRDLIDAAIDGQMLKASAAPARMSLRDLTRRYSMVNPPMSLFLDFMQNDSLDAPISMKEEAFLPDELERQLDALKVAGPDGSLVPLVKRKWNWFTSNRVPPPPESPRWTLKLLLISLLTSALLALWYLAGTGFMTFRRVIFGLGIALSGLVPGILGPALFLMSQFTDHLTTRHNENMLQISPLNIALLPLGFMLAFNAKRARPALRWLLTVIAGLSVLGALLKVLPSFHQDNWNVIALTLPINVTMAALFWVEFKRTQKPA